ncbi:hypothetical protein MGG_12937 [Pyricularia oryzae 70-15]|uniref:Uncharacterized protein n=1 Tax=Pyricularia oryzae (strain 70-15 / ATCC MYA-4617 / FGSC 8958) TaxID=242507 RepID=G4N4H9_PYRO7|nr:uncharacterized protein MGG_12937 [Pyricularia oryzae 70-15]EHA52847.1 hypothetical protein MGG_12937 [Pyricularia oryzae 70-15]
MKFLAFSALLLGLMDAGICELSDGRCYFPDHTSSPCHEDAPCLKYHYICTLLGPMVQCSERGFKFGDGLGSPRGAQRSGQKKGGGSARGLQGRRRNGRS